MASFKITVVEVKHPAEGEPPRALLEATETKVFEQTLEDLNLRNFVRQLNATPRVRRNRAKTSNA